MSFGEATTMVSAFWDDLARDLEDPDFRARYEAESIRIAADDRTVNRGGQFVEPARAFTSST